jgi:hypothetical protein
MLPAPCEALPLGDRLADIVTEGARPMECRRLTTAGHMASRRGDGIVPVSRRGSWSNVWRAPAR